MAKGVHHIRCQIIQCPANRNIPIFLSWLNIKEGGIDRELGRTIRVNQSAFTFWCSCHLLTTHNQIVYGQVRIHLQQHLSQLRGIASTGNAVIDNEVMKQHHILACLLRYCVERSANCQNRIKILNRSIERE